MELLESEREVNVDQFETILFDFGNTMADEFFFRKNSQAIPNFSEVMDEVVYRPYYDDPQGDNLLNQWMTGQKKKEDIANLVSEVTKTQVDEVLKLMESGCRNLIIFESVFKWAKSISRNKKTAIVTINADIFSDYIVDEYNLSEIFPVIINSCHYNTIDKVEVCKEALKQLGNLPLENSLLIDNTKKCCEDFKKAGGSAYQFFGEKQFQNDFKLVK